MKININDVKRIKDIKVKRKLVNIVVTIGQKQWLKENDVSPTKLFHAALKEIGYSPSKTKGKKNEN